MAGGIDPGTGALINQLANPPNPLEKFGQTVNALAAAKQFQADQAVAGAYQQSIDPQTGQFDQGRFNALASQGPGAWKFGDTMRSAGAGLQAQGLGTQADLEAKNQVLTTAQAYMTPLYQRIVQGGKVSGSDILAQLDNIPPGTLPPGMLDNIRAKATQIGDGDASGLVLGGYAATGHGLEMLKAFGPQTAGVAAGNRTEFVPTNPLYPGGVGRGGAVYGGVSPDTASDIVVVHRSDGIDEQMPRWKANQVLGGAVPGTPGVFYSSITGPAQPQGSGTGAGQPPAPAGRPGEPTGRPAPAAPPAQGGGGGGAQPPVPQPPPVGTPPVTYGQTPPPGQAAAWAASTDSYNFMRADVPNSVNRVFTMQQALSALQDAKTGPGTQTLQAINGVLGTWAPDWLANATGSKEAATKYDEANKYLQQVANATAGAIGGQATNDKLAAAVTANPSVHVQDLAANQVLHVMIGQERMKQYLWKQAQAQNVQPNQYATWAADWAASHDPRAFVVDQMGPKAIKQLQDSLIKNGKATPEGKRFADTVTELQKNDAMPSPSAPPGQD